MKDSQSLKATVWSASSTKGERNDCTVKATAIVTGIHYDTVHTAYAKAGRVRGKGVYRAAQKEVLDNLGFTIEEQYPVQPNGSRYTPKTIGNYCRKGAWMVHVRGHVLAVVDGEVLDWTEGRKHRITQVWKITPKSGADEMSKKLTEEYNSLAQELGFPTLAARIRATKAGTPEERVQRLRELVEEKRAKEKPVVEQPTGIKPVRGGTSLSILVETVITNPGITRGEIQTLLGKRSVAWRTDSIAAAMSYDVPHLGYRVEKNGRGQAATYAITNATAVVLK